jgi:hypothetical protein
MLDNPTVKGCGGLLMILARLGSNHVQKIGPKEKSKKGNWIEICKKKSPK